MPGARITPPMDPKAWVGLVLLLVVLLVLLYICVVVRSTFKKNPESFTELEPVQYQYEVHSVPVPLLTEQNLEWNYSSSNSFCESSGLQQDRAGSECGESAVELGSEISRLEQERGSVCGDSAVEPALSSEIDCHAPWSSQPDCGSEYGESAGQLCCLALDFEINHQAQPLGNY